MLTADRPDWARAAINNFETQTYRDSYLLIVDNGKDSIQQWGVEFPDSLRDRLQYHRVPPLTIGELRNIGCSLASGEFIAHWDDDDYSAPNRLAIQMEKLDSASVAVVGFHSMKFTDGSRWWKYMGVPHIGLGTSLVYRREWWRTHPFQAVQIGEDNAFSIQAHANDQLVTMDGAGDLQPGRGPRDLMIANCHATNTCKKDPTPEWMPL